jgi:hypothetical protein
LNQTIKTKVVAHLSPELGAAHLTEPTGCFPFHAVHAQICKKIVVFFLAGCVGLIYAKRLKI